MNITYAQLKEDHGSRADEIATKVCAIHGGLGLFDFKSHRGGLDISGCSEADQARIKTLIAKPKSEDKKEGK